MGGELWESGRIAWSAGSGKTLRGLSCIYTDVHRYNVIKWRGNVKRFCEHPRMSERTRAKTGDSVAADELTGTGDSELGMLDYCMDEEEGRNADLL